MAQLKQYLLSCVLVLTLTVLLNTPPTEAGNCAAAADCKNKGTCPNPGTAPCDCSSSTYFGDTCEDECAQNSDCGTGGTCEAGTPKKCKCQDDTMHGPKCAMDKSGASTVAGFSLVSVYVVLASYLL